MKKYHLTTVLLIFTVFIFPTILKSQCVSDTNNVYTFIYQNAKYEIVKENKNWINASACAVERGAMLAEINSQEEQDSIFFHVNNAGITAANTVAPDGGGASYIWIGGNDLGVEGQWVWNGDNDNTSVQFWQGTTSGSAVDHLYNNWGNEPDDWNGQDGLGLAFTNWPLGVAGQWNDVDHTNQLYYIIEYEPDLSGIDDPSKLDKGFSIYPNPASDKLRISINDILIRGNNNTLRIYNIAGKVVKTEAVSNTELDIDISNLDGGVYMIILETSDYKSAPVKLLKKK